MINKVLNCDCMDYMKDIPDNYFELAIVDPEYGINVNFNIGKRKDERVKHEKKGWDKTRPSEYYFKELIRVSKDQVIWGGNYFTDLIPVGKEWIVWDKMITGKVDFSACELAWSSFNGSVKKIGISIQQNYLKEARIHPTQKPVSLYKWLLKNYAKPGDKILDTHIGSGSIRIACHDMGFELHGCELEKDYWTDQEARYKKHILQDELFTFIGGEVK